MQSIVLAVTACAVACGGPKVSSTGPVLVDQSGPADAQPAPVVVTETWAGTLVLVRDLVDVVVHFTSRDGVWSATLDVPAAGVNGLALSDITLADSAIKFTLVKPAAPQANEVYAFARTGDSASGALATAGQTFYAKLVKLAPGEAPRSAVARPQTPKPPFPYTERDVEITAPEDGKLAGTLTLPSGSGPFPAILLVSGSGQQDRDETIFGHKSFALLADQLTRNGIAVLRTDDRGTGKTEGKLGSLDTDIGDARAAFEWLIGQKEIDPKRAGMLGHSVGGLIAPVVAAKTNKVKFIVALAGPGVPGVELVPMQLEVSLRAKHAPEAMIKAIVDGQRSVGAAIVTGNDAKIRAALKAAAIATSAAAGAPKPSDADLDQMIAASMPSVTNAWTVGFFKTDPAPAWKKFKGPVLAVIGDKDTQVPADVNLAKIGAALKAGGNRRYRPEKRPGLNHLYQHAATGLLEEYGMIEETFDPDTLELVVKWVVDTTRKR